MSATALASALAGRPAAALLDLPSVERMVGLLETQCREASWARVAVGTLERFRSGTESDLTGLLDRALVDGSVAEQSVAQYARSIGQYGPAHVSALTFGVKVWFRANGVGVSWRPPAGAHVEQPALVTEHHSGTRLLLLAMIGSGLSAAEVMAIRVGELGSIDASGRLIRDRFAEPLAVSYRSDTCGTARISFLSYAARSQWLAALDARMGAVDDESPFVASDDETPQREVTLERARARHAALIAAGNEANVATCRLTGDFFRHWGMPGARFAERQQSAV